MTSLLNGDADLCRDLGDPGRWNLLWIVRRALGDSSTLISFFLGRQLLRRSEDLQVMFSTLVIAGSAYSLLLLFEIQD